MKQKLVQSSLKRNIGFSAMGSLGAQALSLIGTIALARMLSPHEFGLMVVVTIFTAFALIFIDMGMGAALVHCDKPKQQHFATAFWFNLGVSLLLMVLVAVFSPIMSNFFTEPELVRVLWVASVLLPLNAMSIVPMSILQKSERFQHIAVVELLSVIAGLCTALTMAWLEMGVWALVGNVLVIAFARLALLFWLTKWKPTWAWCSEIFQSLWSYSGYLFGAGIINYIISNADSVLVGKIFGTQVLGVYKYASQLANIPASVVNSVLSRVFFASYLTYKHDRARIRALHLKVIGLIAFVVFPSMLILSVLSDMFVLIVLGDKWVPMSDILGMMCLVFLMDSVGSMSGTLFLSQGKTRALFWLNFIVRFNQLAAMLIGIQYGLFGLLWGLLLVRVFNFVPVYYVVGKTVGFKVKDVIIKIGPVLMYSVMAVGAILLVRDNIEVPRDSMLGLISLGMLGFVTYGTLLWLFSKKFTLEVADLLFSKLFRA